VLPRSRRSIESVKPCGVRVIRAVGAVAAIQPFGLHFPRHPPSSSPQNGPAGGGRPSDASTM
jgi:hypothetical protein